jgi:hypothetical protein
MAVNRQRRIAAEKGGTEQYLRSDVSCRSALCTSGCLANLSAAGDDLFSVDRGTDARTHTHSFAHVPKKRAKKERGEAGTRTLSLSQLFLPFFRQFRNRTTHYIYMYLTCTRIDSARKRDAHKSPLFHLFLTRFSFSPPLQPRAVFCQQTAVVMQCLQCSARWRFTSF